MPRIILMIAVAIGLSHVITFSTSTDEIVRVIWKFASVGTLCIYACFCARNTDGWLIAAVMLFSALSDVLLVTIGEVPGALSFIIADCLAIWLYSRHLRARIGLASASYLISFTLAAGSLAYVLPNDRSEALGLAIFTLPLAAMAGFATLSRFPGYLVGLGATMVLSSDLLIFARMGALKDLIAGEELVWLSYFVGEVLVVMGVTRALRLGIRQPPVSQISAQ